MVSHENRMGVTYYLHGGVTKTGKPRYFFARAIGAGALDRVPEGYEISESINGVVSVRRRRAGEKGVTADDLALVQAELRRHERLRHHRAGVIGDAIVIHAPNVDAADLRDLALRLGAPWRADALLADSMKRVRYEPVMKFVRTRAGYAAHRMTYRGHGGWSWALQAGPLAELASALVPVIGTEEFFELV